MRIRDLYGRDKPVFSFEFFPPKTDKGEQKLLAALADLKQAVEPDFVSVTYGAGGSTQDRTHAIVVKVQRDLGTPAMAHQTCVGVTRDDIRRGVKKLAEHGVENILALRGDPPKDQDDFEVIEGGLGHATDLIELLAAEFDLSIGAACYPEVHPESTDAESDLEWTIEKQRLGAGFLVTQLFFDNERYFAYVERARSAGLTIPIVPGIMPITNVAQVERFTKMCGATIPEALLERLRSHQEDPAAVMADGIEHAITQALELLDRGAPGLHFYTLNKSHATRSILAALRRA
ncbi:MAG: methylenetetrahydrofolate reductase (NADPH) [Chlamydiales bacterium]|jgi:methylenetetrahydrofolate reductase (NADPH)